MTISKFVIGIGSTDFIYSVYNFNFLSQLFLVFAPVSCIFAPFKFHEEKIDLTVGLLLRVIHCHKLENHKRTLGTQSSN